MDSIDQQGGVQPGDPATGEAWFISKHGQAWSPAGNFAGRYMTFRSTRYDDGIVGPYPSREAALAAADRWNSETS